MILCRIKLDNMTRMYNSWTHSFQGSRQQMRPVALAGFSGGLAGWVVQLVREAAVPPALDYLGPSFTDVAEECRCVNQLERIWGLDLDLRSVLTGIVLGFGLGPLVECLNLLRQLWTFYLRSQFAHLRPARGGYRVLG